LKTARLGDIALVFNGNSISAAEKDKHYRGAQGMPYVGTAEVGFDAEVNYDAGVSIPAAKLQAFKVAKAGTALVCAEGGSAGRKVGFLDRDVCFGNKLFAMQPKAGWDGKFLFYFSQSEEFRDQFRALTTGLIGGVSVKKFKGIEVPAFSHSDQRRIVAVLDEAFAAIATATANAEKNLANARELIACELSKIFTVESAGWELKRLSEVARDFGRGKSRHRPRGDPKLYGSAAPLIQTGDVSNADHWLCSYTQMYSEMGVSQSKLWPKGTVCVAIVGANVGESAILNFDACFPDSVIGIVPDDDKSDAEYIEYLLQFFKNDLKEKGKGTARDNINIETFQNQLMPFPDVPTQHEIVARVNALNDAIGELVSLIRAKQAALAELKQSVLQRAFTGELTAAMPKTIAA